jgi:hypothetical protein
VCTEPSHPNTVRLQRCLITAHQKRGGFMTKRGPSGRRTRGHQFEHDGWNRRVMRSDSIKIRTRVRFHLYQDRNLSPIRSDPIVNRDRACPASVKKVLSLPSCGRAKRRRCTMAESVNSP